MKCANSVLQWFAGQDIDALWATKLLSDAAKAELKAVFPPASDRMLRRAVDPGVYSQLTSAGAAHMVRVGERLGRRYIDELGLLHGTLHADEVVARSTDATRTVRCAT